MKENIAGSRAEIRRHRVEGEEGSITEGRSAADGGPPVSTAGRAGTGLAAPWQQHSCAHRRRPVQRDWTRRGGGESGGEVKVVQGPGPVAHCWPRQGL